MSESAAAISPVSLSKAPPAALASPASVAALPPAPSGGIAADGQEQLSHMLAVGAGGQEGVGKISDQATSGALPIGAAPAAALSPAKSVGIADGQQEQIVRPKQGEASDEDEDPPSPGTQKMHRRAIVAAMNALSLSEAQFLPGPEQELNVVRYLRAAFPPSQCSFSSSDRRVSIFAVQLAWAIWTAEVAASVPAEGAAAAAAAGQLGEKEKEAAATALQQAQEQQVQLTPLPALSSQEASDEERERVLWMREMGEVLTAVGALESSSSPPPRLLRKMPFSYIWALDPQQYAMRSNDRELSDWQKTMPLLPMLTLTMENNGDALYHSALLADSRVLESHRMQPSNAALLQQQAEQGIISLGVNEMQQAMIKAHRDNTYGYVLQSSEDKVTNQLQLYRALTLSQSVAPAQTLPSEVRAAMEKRDAPFDNAKVAPYISALHEATVCLAEFEHMDVHRHPNRASPAGIVKLDRGLDPLQLPPLRFPIP